mgnify:CR=1 FL=1
MLSCFALSAFAQEMGNYKGYTADGGTVTINSDKGQLVIQRRVMGTGTLAHYFGSMNLSL